MIELPICEIRDVAYGRIESLRKVHEPLLAGVLLPRSKAEICVE